VVTWQLNLTNQVIEETRKDPTGYSRNKESFEAHDVEDDDVVMRFEAFIDAVESNEDLQANLDADTTAVIEVFDKLKTSKEEDDAKDSKGDLRKDFLIEKLVAHIRGSMHAEHAGSVHLDPECTTTTAWIVKFLRALIEKRWNMTIDERDDDGGETEDKAAAETQTMLNMHGVTALCIDLIAPGIQSDVRIEAIKLLIALLFKEGGHHETQETIYSHLAGKDSTLFFKAVDGIFKGMTEWQQSEAARANSIEDVDEEESEESMIVKCLQLMSEGHFKPNQQIMLTQPHNEHESRYADYYIPQDIKRDPAPNVGPKSKKMALGSITFDSAQHREFGIYIKDNSFFLRCEKNDPVFCERLNRNVAAVNNVQIPGGRNCPNPVDYWPRGALNKFCNESDNVRLRADMDRSYRRWHDGRCMMHELYDRVAALLRF
jgi:hypothetical protein